MLPSRSVLNVLGLDVRGLPLEAFFRAGCVLYAAAYLGWTIAIARGRRRVSAWGPFALSLVVWALTTFPLQRPYGLQAPASDRLRHLWWAATAAAGNPPWESGWLGQRTLEPAWSALVSLLALRDPTRVIAVYPFLPVLGLAATAAALLWGFRARPLRAALVASFVLLASTQALDHLEPFRMFWARHFLLKPNHALGLAMVPLLVGVLARPLTVRRGAAAALLLGTLGWVFVVDWALFCASLAGFAALAAVHPRRPRQGNGVLRLAAVAGASALVVAPFVVYLSQHFPNAVSLAAGADPGAPARSPWGDARPAAHSLVFLATFDLGPHFPLALVGAWAAWRRGRRFDLLWLGALAAAYAAWSATAVLYMTARARAADEVYWFLAFAVAVHAGIGAHAIAVRLSAVARREGRAWPARRVAAAGLLAWLPFTIGWWWDPPRTDPHFTAALEPVPPEMQALAAWVRARTSGQDLLAAAPRSAAWLPALAGRRVIRVPTDDLAGFDPATVPAPGVRVLVADAPGAAEPPGVVEEFRAGSLTAYRLGR